MPRVSQKALDSLLAYLNKKSKKKYVFDGAYGGLRLRRGRRTKFAKPYRDKKTKKMVTHYYQASGVDLIGYRLKKREMFYVLRAMTTYKDVERRK